MLFATVAQIFDKIEAESSRLTITHLLAQLLGQATPEEASIISNLALGQLRPPYKGTQFNFAEKNVTCVIAQLLNITEQQVQGLARELGDLGTVVTQFTWPAQSQVTLQYVYNQLVVIENITGNGAQEKKAALLLSLLQTLDPRSAQYVIRIILQTLRLGFSDMTLIDAFSWMIAGNKSLRSIIEHAYNVCVDIGLIVHVLKEQGIPALEAMRPVVGIPIRPAAAERMPSARDIVAKIGACVAQPKLDGFRLQIHISNHGTHAVHFFSRNLVDMSTMFPDLLAYTAKLPVQDVICEGEAIGYDPDTQTFLPFQETVKRKRKHGIEAAAKELPLQVFLFDVLYLNGTNMMPLPHRERRKHLQAIADAVGDPVFVIEEHAIDSAQTLEAYFFESIAAGLEGIVVKKPDAPYQPGKRNFNWIKLKRHEESKLEDTIDAVILGYYSGSGKRAAFGIGAFLVGVYDTTSDVFETIAKVGTGLTDEQWRVLREKCDAYKVSHQPKNVICAKELMPDVWVTPALVCQILADEITLSPLHSAGKTAHQLGYALRFPRFIGYCPDKTPEQATSVAEIKSLFKDQRRSANTKGE